MRTRAATVGLFVLSLAACGGRATLGTDRCALTDLHASVAVHLADGRTLSCANPLGDAGAGFQPPTWSFAGTITDSDAISFVMNASDCEMAVVGDTGVDPGCVPGVVRVELGAPGTDLTRLPHVAVRVQVQIGGFRGCPQSLQVSTADAPDASVAPGQLLLAVADGGSPFAGAPYEVARVPLGCSTAKGCGGPAPDMYAFDFTARGGAAVRVPMGATAALTIAGASYAVHNLRSYQGEACDDYWNWAYTIYADPK